VSGLRGAAIVRYLNKELVSVAIWINDAKEDLVVGPVGQLLPVLLETSCLLLRLSHGRRSVDDSRWFELGSHTGNGVLNTGRGHDGQVHGLPVLSASATT